MIKSFEMNGDISADTSDTVCDNMKDFSGDLASNDGVDLNIDVRKAAYFPPPVVDAIYTEAPKPPYNNVFDYLEELGSGFSAIQDAKNQHAENEELNNALNETIPEAHPPQTEIAEQSEENDIGDDLNKGE